MQSASCDIVLGVFLYICDKIKPPVIIIREFFKLFVTGENYNNL